MERFVFVAAIVVAVIYAIVAIVHTHVGIDFSDADAAPIVHVAPGTMAAQTYVGSRLEIKHAAATVAIIPEDRQDFSIQIDNPGHAPMPAITAVNGDIVIDGNLRGRIGDCDQNGVELRGYDDVKRTDLPHIVVHAPRALTAAFGGAVYADIGAAQSVDGSFSGCGDSTIADVAGPLKVALSGSGAVHAGAAQSLEADLSGSGEVAAATVAGGARVNISGSGTATIATLNGAIEDNSSGSGDLHIQGGAITTADISLVGSGDAVIAAPIQSLKTSTMGSGDVKVSAPVHDVDADLVGSGDVELASVTGTVNRHTVGSGDVRIGH
jgi:hypothetical protein